MDRPLPSHFFSFPKSSPTYNLFQWTQSLETAFMLGGWVAGADEVVYKYDVMCVVGAVFLVSKLVF